MWKVHNYAHIVLVGCQVKHFYHINRHGTRHPSDSTSDDEWELMPGIRDQIVDNHKQGKGNYEQW